MNGYPAEGPLGIHDPSLGGDELGGPPYEVTRSRQWRGLMAWSSTSAPVGLLLLAGLAIGPAGINLLSRSTLTLLDPVVPVALAAFGMLVGLSPIDRRTGDLRVLWVATLAAAVAAAVVSAGFGLLSSASSTAVARPLLILILGAGICAATSLTLPSEDSLEPRLSATRVMELGVLLPIVAGGLVLPWVNTGSFAGAAGLVAHACGVIVAVAAAAWLLLSKASSATDERVFAVSALLLVGGVAAALSVSALFAGLAAGLLWRYTGRHPRETIRRDVLFVQHPLLVLVLLVAGARAELSPFSIALGVGYVVLRAAGLMAAGAAARRAAGVKAFRDLGRQLLPPGVFGVGFALNAVSVLGADASMLLAVVVVGTIGSELTAVLLSPRSVSE